MKLVRYSKAPEEQVAEAEEEAQLEIPGGKQVPYFVERVSEDYEEEAEETQTEEDTSNSEADDSDTECYNCHITRIA